MSATINADYLLRRALTGLVLALVLAAAVATTVHALEPSVHAQVLRGGVTQVSGFDGGAGERLATH